MRDSENVWCLVKAIGVTILVGLVVAGLWWVASPPEPEPEPPTLPYSYVDLDGNEGKAKDCSSYRSSPHCISEDGTIVLVKSYYKEKKEWWEQA